MNNIAIRADKLGKRYRIGERQPYLALRDVLAQAAGAPLRMFRRAAKSSSNGANHIWALKDASFEVREGEVIGIIGCNGSGKSTLLKILARVTKPTEGSARIRGRMGSLLEVGTGFHSELTGRENVFLSGGILGMKKREIVQKFDEIVAFAEVEKFIDTPVKHYSSGMQMRLAFAVAAHLEPEVLLIDEVLAVGDAPFQKKCLGKMGEAARGGRTIVFVSHQMNQIRRLCGRVLWVDGGKIRECGPTTKVTSAYEALFNPRNTDARRPETSNAKARFLRWEIIEPRAKDRNELSSFGAVTVRFVLEVNKPLRAAHHGIALYDSESRLMWGTEANALHLEPGIRQFAYTFPSLPLRPGFYSWQVSLYDDGNELVDVWDCLPGLLVATQPVTHSKDEWAGILNIPSRFESSCLEEKVT